MSAAAFGVCAALWYGLAAWLGPAAALPWLWRRCGYAAGDREARLDRALALAASWLLSPGFLPLCAALWLIDRTDRWPLD